MLKEYLRPSDGLDKNTRKTEIARLQACFSAQQQKIRSASLPVIVLVEGWGAAGKGTLINELISELDPRFSSVFCAAQELAELDRYPFLMPFFRTIPENGKILFMDGGWMESTVRANLSGALSKKELRRRILSINRFERQLRDSGYVLLKLFVNISKDEQSDRFRELCRDDSSSWRVTAEDLWQNEDYGSFRKAYEAFMEETGAVTPWNILDGSKKTLLKYDALRLITETIDARLTAGKYCGEALDAGFPMAKTPRLAEVDLSLSIQPEIYKEELKVLQKKLTQLHNEVYLRRIPVIICYEGWDAAGKGGNIRRLAYPLDARGLDIYPVAAPLPSEKARHFLWRFWKRLPCTGRIAIFDRSWYGRVLVERIEGYCSEHDWKRAYNEINEFEEELHSWGAVILKFWMHIDWETQLQRFTERENTPEKRWKLTDEDWRNREKWPQYEEAVSEMLEKTSTGFAPWHIIAANDKLYARIQVLRIVVNTLERAVKDEKG